MADIKAIIEENNENLIDTWTLNCLPLAGKGGRFLGKLYVTDKSLYFEAQYDTSLGGTLKSLITSGAVAMGHPLLVSQEIINSWEEKGFIKIAKQAIKNIESKSSFFKKTVTVTLSDDSQYIFDYGMMGIKKLEEAIRK
jgi:hypothetical protein